MKVLFIAIIICVLCGQIRAENLITIDLDKYQVQEKQRFIDLIPEYWLFSLASTMSLDEIQNLCKDDKLYEKFISDKVFSSSNELLNTIMKNKINTTYCEYHLKYPIEKDFSRKSDYYKNKQAFEKAIEEIYVDLMDSYKYFADPDNSMKYFLEVITARPFYLIRHDIDLKTSQKILLLHQMYKKIAEIKKELEAQKK